MMLLVDGEINMTEKFRLIPQGRCLMEIRSRLQWNSKRLSFGERISSLAASQKSYFAYALGRELEVSDRPVIDEIVQEISKPEKGLRDLIQDIVASRSFLEN